MNLLLPPKIARFKFNFNLLKKNIFVFLLLMPSVFAFSQYQTNNSGGAWENISSWVTPRPSPSTDPDDGVLSSDWYSINGTITRSGSITQNVTTIINGTLEVSGDYIITGGQLTIIGKLIVHGNFSSNCNITITGGGQLIIYNDVNITGGTIDSYGDVVIGGNYITTSNNTVRNSGNFAVAGDYTDTNGNLTLPTSPVNNQCFYALATLNTPSGSTTPPCSVVYTPSYSKTCDYGNLADLIANDNSLYLILLNMGKIPCPSITITTQPISQTNCEGTASSFSVVASGVTDYQWRKEGVNISGANAASYSIPVVSTSDVGNYDVIISNATCSKLSNAVSLTMNSLPAKPTITPSGSVAFCHGFSTNLVSSAATSYLWSDGSTNQTLTVNTAANYTVQVKDANNCQSVSSDAVVVTENLLPIPIISGLTTVCEASVGNIYSTASGMSNYGWTVSAGGTITAGGTSLDNSITVTWNTVGPQSVSVSYTNSNGCTSATPTTKPVTVNPSFTPSVSIVKTSTSICQGGAVTFKATPTNGGTNPIYNWFVNSSSIISSSSDVFSYNLTANDGVKCVMTSSACAFPSTNPATSTSLAGVVKYREVNLSTISPSAYCAGSSFNANITVPCDFPSPNTFTVQLSDATGSFATPVNIGSLAAYLAGSYSIPSTLPVTTATGAGYRIRVVSSYVNVLEGLSQPSNLITISASTGTPIAPTTWGTTGWNVFCYSGNSYTMSANSYMGYYTENNLSFDSRTRWASSTSPATANGTTGLAFQGCTSMPANNIALSFMRTNIPCGYYQIDIPYHDDAYELYIDGVKIASYYGCCISHTNVWTGWINTSTQIEFRLFQAGGGSGLQVNFINSNPLVVSPIVTTICSGYSTTLTATGGGGGVTYSWLPTTGLSASTGSSVVASPTTTTAYTVTATDASSHCMASAIATVNVSSAINLTVTAAPTTIVCGGVTSTTLTATGANTYLWSSVPAGFSATGSSVTVSPIVNTVYSVTGTTGCKTDNKTISITGMNPGGGTPIDTADYGVGKWNALCHASTTYTDYYGYYTENNLNFNTATRFATNAAPSTANATSGSAYSGCTIPLTYTIRFKRTGVPCGYYALNVNYHDDGTSFWVNGKKVWENTGYVATPTLAVWTGFIGPSTKLELRLANTGGPGRLDVSFVPTVPNSLSTPATICAGTSTTFSTTTMTGAVYSWSAQDIADASWLTPPATGATCVATPPVLTPDGIHNFICSITDASGTGCSIDQILPLEVRALANTSVTPTATTVNCPSANVKLTASGANSYNWTSVPAGFTATGAIVTVNPSVSTIYSVSGSNNCNAIDASSSITVNPLPDPTSFPSGKWNAYIYNSTATTAPLNYTGSYSFTDAIADDYSFNTTTQWNNATGPSLAVGYSGCAIGGINYTIVYKRTGFKCGYYQIDIPYHDDGAYMYIDGVLKWSHTGCCDIHTNVWSGYLTSTSTIDFRFTNGGGPGYLITKFTPVSPIIDIMPLAPAVCAGGAVGVNLTVTANGTGNSYSWTPTTALSDPTNATTNANPMVTTTYTVNVSNCGGAVMGSKSITVDALSPSIIGIQPVDQNICENTNTAFSITSSNPMGFVWQISTDGGGNWSNLADAGVYSGASTKDLALTTVPFSLDGMKYRCMTTVCVNKWSNDALLTVKKAPTLTLGSFYPACLGAAQFSIPFSSTGSPTMYSLSGFSAISYTALGATPLLISIGSQLAGTYPSILKVKDSNGCESLPVPLTLKLLKVTPYAIYCRPNK